jgi:uncharacterized protein YecE (DUF72 family)
MSNVYVGSMGWSYDFWKPGFYPKTLASSDFLAYYSKQFNSVEVDSTFYRIPREQTVLSWKEQTPIGFVFSLKFPRVITHVKMLRDCEEETRVFLERAELLEEKLGSLLLQFPFSFRPEHVPLLEKFLGTLPKEHRYVVEVRDKKMLENSFYSMLKANGAALAWVDSASMPIITEVTSNFLYVRWEGDRKKVNGTLGKTEIDRTSDIKLWARKLKPYLKKQMDVFGYFSKYYSGNPPTDIQTFIDSSETTNHP